MLKKLIGVGKTLAFSETARNTYWVLAGNGIITVSAFLFTILVARILTTFEFGIFSALSAFIVLFSDLADIGVGSTLYSFIPPLLKNGETGHAGKIFKTLFVFQIAVAAILSLLIIILAESFSQLFFHNSAQAYLIRWSTFGVFSFIIMAFAVNALSSKQKFKQSTILYFIYAVPRIILIIPFILLGSLNLTSSLVIYMMTSLPAAVLGFIMLPFDFAFASFAKESIKDLFKFSGIMGISKLFMAVYSRLDVLMLISLGGAFETGIYSAASRIASIYPLMIGSFGTVLAPKFSTYKTGHEALSFLKKVIWATLAFMVSILVFYFLAEPFVIILFGNSYRDSIPVFKALLLTLLPFLATVPAVNLLIYTFRKPQLFAVICFMALVCIFVSNLLLIPKLLRFGPVFGAGVAYSLILISSIAFDIWFFVREKKV